MKVVVEGRENIPDTPSVIMIKHTTILETYGHVPMFPTTAWVVKRELLWVPVVGWAIGLVLNPIAINRGKGRSAVKQVIEQGKQRLAERHLGYDFSGGHARAVWRDPQIRHQRCSTRTGGRRE